jgi:hypothetical protein
MTKYKLLTHILTDQVKEINNSIIVGTKRVVKLKSIETMSIKGIGNDI